jgi:hypothetical protein
MGPQERYGKSPRRPTPERNEEMTTTNPQDRTPAEAVTAALVELGWVRGGYTLPAGVLPASTWGWTV